MPLTDLVAPNAILPALKVNNKKQALHELAARAAVLSGQSEKAIFEILMQREKLGSTAIGNGIAIPHGKMANLPPPVRIVRAARPADRFRGARRPAGRSDLSSARARRCRRRSPQSAGPRRAAVARAGGRPQAARFARRGIVVRGFGYAVGLAPRSGRSVVREGGRSSKRKRFQIYPKRRRLLDRPSSVGHD